MRLLYVAHIRLPTEKAHGLQIMKTCEALADAGAEVELVIPSRRTPIEEDPFKYYSVRPVFTLTVVRVPDLVRFGTFGFLATLFSFSERVRLRKNFQSADIIYSRDHLALLRYVPLRRVLVFEAHGKPGVVSRFVARRAWRVVVISRALKDAYVTAGVRPERIVIAPDAVDPAQFSLRTSREEARAMFGLPQERSIIAYVGHLYERKGADTLAHAATEMSEALFLFVGGTTHDIGAFRQRWGNVQNIRIEGHVPPSRVPLYLRAANVLVLPNSSKNEDAARFTSPMKLFEYLASGIPIVASDVPATREILTNEVARLFVADDPGSLTQTIREVLAEGTDAETRAAKARQLVAGYTWQARGDLLLEALSENVVRTTTDVK